MAKASHAIDKTTAELISGRASTAFQPRTPIGKRDFFAGRWDQIMTIVDSVGQVGLHIVIYGERGVGKTSIANIIKPLLHAFDQPSDETPQSDQDERIIIKVNASSEDTFSTLWNRAFDEIDWVRVAPKFGFSAGDQSEVLTLKDHLELPDTVTIDHVRRTLNKLPDSVFVFDEFDRVPRRTARPITDLIKALSDYAVQSTAIIVGISETVDELISDHASIRRCLIQVPMPRMKPEELKVILKKAEEVLSVEFADDAADRIVQMSQGLPHYTHLIGQDAVRCACEARTRRIQLDHVNKAFLRAMKNTYQSIRSDYSNATYSSHPENLYEQVALACAIAASDATESHGFFQPSHIVEPLTQILGRDVQISTFNKHLTEFCTDEKRKHILERRGQQRSYQYRFKDPLMPPYVIMKGLSSEMVSEEVLATLTST